MVAILPPAFVSGIIEPLQFARHKTKVGIELEMNEELAELWKWFIKFKREEAMKWKRCETITD